MSDYLVFVLSNIGVIAFIGLSAYLLLLVGQISFGQQAFFGIGAYAAGIATALWGWPLMAGLAWGGLVAATAACLLGIPTLRSRGLYFSIATLAFAEAVRLGLEIFRYQVEVDGEPVGPLGSDGFRGIRYIYDHDISAAQYLGLIYGLLALVIAFFFVLERSRLGSILRMLGEDEVATEMQGVPPAVYKVLATALSGVVAGLGGGLYAHLATYLEPKIFGVMLGIHGLAYGLIGGLGTAVGPLVGAALDIGLLQSFRSVASYRMIIFGGLVAVLLIFRPRGLLDEETLFRFRAAWRAVRGRPLVVAAGRR